MVPIDMKHIGLLTKAAISFSLIWYLCEKSGASWEKTLQIIESCNIIFLAVAWLSLLLANILHAFRYQLISKFQDHNFSAKDALEVHFISLWLCLSDNHRRRRVRWYYADRSIPSVKIIAIFADRFVGSEHSFNGCDVCAGAGSSLIMVLFLTTVGLATSMFASGGGGVAQKHCFDLFS